MSQSSQQRLLIGWQEEIDFFEWGIRRVRAKVDTGARTSALDVWSYTLREVPGQGILAELRLALHRHQPERVRVVETPVLRMVAVRSSSGLQEQRPLIATRVRLGRVTKLVQLTVTNRCHMRFPVILGRRFLQGDFIVDVSQRFLLRR